MANMSKEFVATLITMITGFIAILAFLWAISSEIGEIKGETWCIERYGECKQ